jgi:hypothetical protein
MIINLGQSYFDDHQKRPKSSTMGHLCIENPQDWVQFLCICVCEHDNSCKNGPIESKFGSVFLNLFG